jgi:aminocarboxymuconate-semialdehyde decarboxylase
MRGRLREWPWGADASAVRERLRKHPVEYLKQFYADTALMGNSHGLRCTIEFFGIDHVLFGSDFGFGNDYLAKTIIDVTELHLDSAQAKQLCEDNATRLLL